MPDERDRSGRGDYANSPSAHEWHLLKKQVDDNTAARLKYEPMIERIDERGDAFQQTIELVRADVKALTHDIRALVQQLTPIITERAMVLKFLSFIGGAVSALMMTAITWYVIEWLKAR